MRVLTLDIETTSSNKGNPFDKRNKCVMVGLKWQGEPPITYTEGEFSFIQGQIDRAELLVGFNIKFDLHWLRNIGVSFEGKRVYDCQLGEYLLSNQETKLPSLNGALERYGLPLKVDVVKNEYWDKGIDTNEIPTEVLEEYLVGDLVGTESVYQLQTNELVDRNLYTLHKIQCMDLLVLQEMEYNGIIFNTEKAREKAYEISEELSSLVSAISVHTNNININLNSDDHLSCLLYGGIIEEDFRIPVGVFKTGKKVGETRYKILTKSYELPRLVEPLKGTERYKKEDSKDNPRYWLTNADVLKSLKPNKEAAKLLLILARYKELEKLRGTYLIGWSDLIDEMGWDKDVIHGNLNQCIVVTGRLSSSKPNLQNADPTTKIYCESRYV